MIYNIHKPPGPTSHDIVNQIRRGLGIKKVGHAGTLDPFAEGVLVILTESDTKKSDKIMHQEKEYVAEIKLGATSDTYDRTGKICRDDALLYPPKLRRGGRPPLSETVRATLKKFTGEIEQIPPMYSAIKINGQKLYNLARKGIEVERKPRKIKISEIELLSYIYPLLKIRIVCSSGTYIRSLASDIGQELEVGGYLEGLIRTRIGDFCLKDSIKTDLHGFRTDLH